ncbi:LysR family transcriptional regulator [Segniliparus rugosus]|uniref:ModE molybdate transport repressor domain-containing protein n=1 Tax=Segniliparus rugosus (strain ATCC BAA-974 / DSM 45345 / CCUG 50838 / CIP 108380 / JCM 13579 / CDC 945) TaxID=679197 RepID=E5XPC0_SEGRC|nr:LysR family transcriptional regulator [Segniliparus rugosus]EFV13811.1 ModE molybdate transport repressor domain-containing protein [Segniliparus rugosus ATCC BAA-974]
MVLPARVPELAALDVVASVARRGSMGAAARELGLSQQAVSARVRAVERELGLRLFRRSPGGTALTGSGSAVLEWAGAILDSAEKFAAGVEALRGQSSSVRVAASMTVAECLVPSWVVALRNLHPDGQIRVSPMNSASAMAAVLAGEADIGFVECAETGAGLDSRPIGRDELLVVVPRSHPWARSGRVSPSTLASTPLVQREPGSGTRDVFEEALAGRVERPLAPPLLELSSVTALKTAAATAEAPAVLSSLSVAGELAEGRLVRIEVEGLRMPRVLRAVWPVGARLRGPAGDLVALAARRPAGAKM